MKKNAILIAGILFVAGCASSDSQRASYSSYDYPSRYDRADVRVSSTETVERDSMGRVIAPSYVDTSTTVTVDPAAGSYGTSVTGGSRSHSDDDISADSSVRGGSLDARGYHQDANNDEIEGKPNPINPGKEADSSVRGGSIYARDREWNHDSEPSSGERDPKAHMKADSSIRGGSVEARGAREARADLESDVDVDADIEEGSDLKLRGELDTDTRDDFGQGSSATWESDKASGSVRGSANWNASDDLLRDDLNADADNTVKYEFNNDASVGGAARGETGEGSSSLDDEEFESETDADVRAPVGDDLDSSIRIESDLNSSQELEENISGEFDLDNQESRLEKFESDSASDFETSVDVDTSTDLNATDSQSSAISSERSTDITHDNSELSASTEVNLSDGFEAAGAAATSESGSSSSSEVEIQSSADDDFESNDPAMRKPGSPLGISGGEPNFLYENNRAHGVGSAASGEFAESPVNSKIELSEGGLAERVKATLTRESTGTHGLMRNEVARNIQVSADNGEVTLTGTVPTQKDKDMIEVRAREIAGVRSVDNQLTVTPAADATYREEIRGSDLEDVTSDLQE